MEMGSCWSEVVSGEGSAGVSFQWSLEGMVDVVGWCWVMCGVVGHCLVMFGLGGHFVEVAVVVECWEEEEGEVRVG